MRRGRGSRKEGLREKAERKSVLGLFVFFSLLLIFFFLAVCLLFFVNWTQIGSYGKREPQ